MWDLIEKAWQAAYEQAWEAFVNGSLLIGAAITDKNGEVISIGRNRMSEQVSIFKGRTLNPKMAHAEFDALLKLDATKYPNFKEYTLYATAEPCPMCMGMFVMANLVKLKVLNTDSYCGSTHWCEDDKYIASKKIKVEFESGLLTYILPVVWIYYQLKEQNGEFGELEEKLKPENKTVYPACHTALNLYEEKRFDWHIANKTPFCDVFNEIAEGLLNNGLK
jgi:tRNA(adenine34) deaminase